MIEQETQLTQTCETEKLSHRKNAIMELLEEMSASLPPMVMVMFNANRGLVYQFVDAMTLEQTDELLDKAQAIIDKIRCENGEI